MAKAQTPPPKGVGPGGKRLWQSLQSEFEFAEHEEVLLIELTRVVDRLDALEAAIAKDGALIGGRPHAALVEARQLQIVLTRLHASLRLPSGDQDDASALRRPQRRGAARGAYGIASG